MIATRATHTFTPTATRRLALAVVTLLTLTLTAACGGNTATEQNLASVTAVNGNRLICPPDTPIFHKNRCYAPCKKGEKTLTNRNCITNPRKCKEGFMTKKSFRGSTLCYKKSEILFGKGEKCYDDNMKNEKLCYCEDGKRIEYEIKEGEKIYTNGFCRDRWSSGYDGYLQYTPLNTPLKANCPVSKLALCGIGDFSHCVIRKNSTNGRELCVWNLPKSGYPTCEINGNKATCYRTE